MTLTIVIALLSAFFLLASSIKLAGWQRKIFETQLAMFQSYGLNRQAMFLVGLIELFGAVTIWFQQSWLGPLGAAALLATSVGAIFCHLIFDSWKDGIPAMITAAVSASVLWHGWSSISSVFT
ncbi:DoxX family protein [Ruegeria sp. HKCCSP346]|uniref:DoxX family protein n=1 Tax=Ruegeria sp. HKCCSP346 TaxID=2794830 RepID=UPI001AE0EF31|nr:DoxX family protein [Ruegeria sp. HKCCSP346]